jgi:hypothetical protein
VIALAVSAVALYAWYDQNSPHIVLSEVQTVNAKPSCGIFQQQAIGAGFKLSNLGKVDGVAEVHITGGGGTLAVETYVVRAGQTLNETWVKLVDCSESFTVSVWIASVHGP